MASSSPTFSRATSGGSRVHQGPVRLGRGIPSHLVGPPHLVRATSDHAEKINKVLRRSIKVQGGSTASGLKCLLSNACIMTTGLVHHYLTALGIDSEVVAGTISAPNLGFSVPHVWLEVNGEVINTSFVFSEDDEFPYAHLSDGNFQKCSDKKMYLGDDGEGGVPAEIARAAFKDMLASGNNEGIGKSVTFGLKYGPETLLLYHEEMCKYIKNEFDKDVPDLEEEWRRKCWKCLEVKSEAELKKCAMCKLAMYCGQQCQRADWKDHKRQHKQANIS